MTGPAPMRPEPHVRPGLRALGEHYIMSGQIKFAGSWYGTMGQAAAAWAATALPDTSAIERSEDASDAADTLEVYW